MMSTKGSGSKSPGLKVLATLDEIIIHQQIRFAKILTGYETENKFEIKNSQGQVIYDAREYSNCCLRKICGSGRPFHVQIFDSSGNEVIHLHKPFSGRNFNFCCCCCLWCFESIKVYSPPDNLVGVVAQQWGLLRPIFTIRNVHDEKTLKIKGPCFLCCQSVFNVTSADGIAVGKITKKWGGIFKEMVTDADDFYITFAIDLDVNTKALILGACFLIDIMYFER